MSPAIALIVTYALGACSFASLAGRICGVDVRAHGSGNPGATNVGRVLGRGWGLAVLALDIAKGLVPVLLFTAPIEGAPPWLSDPDGRALLLSAAVLGHVFPIQAGFRGGKGVATYLGGCAAFDPVSAAIALVAHLTCKKLLGYVSIASLVLAWVMPAARLALAAAGEGTGDGVGALALLALIITLRHAGNLSRIRAGTEDRYDDAPDPRPTSNSPQNRQR